MAEDQLQRPLKELDLTLHQEKLADIEGAKLLIARVPQPAVDSAAPVTEIDLDVQVAVAIGPQLLVHHEVDFLDGIAIRQLLDESPGHTMSLTLRPRGLTVKVCGQRRSPKSFFLVRLTCEPYHSRCGL